MDRMGYSSGRIGSALYWWWAEAQETDSPSHTHTHWHEGLHVCKQGPACKTYRKATGWTWHLNWGRGQFDSLFYSSPVSLSPSHPLFPLPVFLLFLNLGMEGWFQQKKKKKNKGGKENVERKGKEREKEVEWRNLNSGGTEKTEGEVCQKGENKELAATVNIVCICMCVCMCL